MNTKENMKMLPIMLLLCLFSEAMWGAPENNLSTSSVDIGQRPTEAECIANTKQIRDIMRSISENKKVSQSGLQKLHTALGRNRVFFEKSEKHENIRNLLFGKGENRFEDYDLFYEIKDILILNAKEKLDTNSFAASVWLRTSLFHVLSNNVELSEYLEEIIADFAINAPLAMVKYLKECSQSEFDSVLNGFAWIYEPLGKREELEFALVKISADEKKYAKIIEKIISRMREDCVEHHGGDEHGYCND